MGGQSSVLLILTAVLALVTSHPCPNNPAPPNAIYPTVLSVPTGCPRDQCYFYVEMRVSDEGQEFLDFQMEGKATGYIAIGFGTQRKGMYDADVFACAVNPTTGMVEAFDTYNTAGITWNNIRDTDVSQQSSRNVCPRDGSFTNGTIRCAFSRAVEIFNTLEDKRLDDFYYIQMAYTNNTAVNGSSGLLTLVDHGHNHPTITTMQYNGFTNEVRSAPPTTAAARSNLVACWELAAASIALSGLLLSLM